MSDPVVLDDPTGEGGLAAVLADLIRQNLEQNPGRLGLLDRMRGTVVIVASDEGESTTAHLVFEGGRVRLGPGPASPAALTIQGSYDGILGLSAVPVCPTLGVPIPWKPATRGLVAALGRRTLRIDGLVRHPRLGLRVLALVSVT